MKNSEWNNPHPWMTTITQNLTHLGRNSFWKTRARTSIQMTNKQNKTIFLELRVFFPQVTYVWRTKIVSTILVRKFTKTELGDSPILITIK